jgi:hypothetical protein
MRPHIPPILARGGRWLAPSLLGLLVAGCARDRHEITPTTLGIDQTPRGRMTPFPWPGQDLTRTTSPSKNPTTDPEAALASVGR